MNFISVKEKLQNGKTLDTELNLDHVERLVKNTVNECIVVYLTSGDNLSIEPFDTEKLSV